MPTSIQQIFKIGIGPSSSHTVGPMKAARHFVTHLIGKEALDSVAELRVELYGSLALTGRGHGTVKAILLGLLGERPDSIDPGRAESALENARTSGRIRLSKQAWVPFRECEHIVWRVNESLPGHPNGMRFTAFDHGGNVVSKEIYYSTGGGFIRNEGQAEAGAGDTPVPYPYRNSAQMLAQASRAALQLWDLVRRNEEAMHGEKNTLAFLHSIWLAMRSCLDRGMCTEGVLPGGLHVRRRAPSIAARLRAAGHADPMSTMDWVNVFAMAVNEENAAGGRVVTAPTNGAAGVVPAVAKYYEAFVNGASQSGIHRFLLVAGAIGALYKDNASISGAEVGCQGEVGVACSMAAAGLAAACGGTPEQIEQAAEIAMEHHLGMTCDPVGGLVQIPCIERNAVGAVKAINACRMALQGDGTHRVSLDQVMQTMVETGRDMQTRYKETSLGGLAVNVVSC